MQQEAKVVSTRNTRSQAKGGASRLQVLLAAHKTLYVRLMLECVVILMRPGYWNVRRYDGRPGGRRCYYRRHRGRCIQPWAEMRNAYRKTDRRPGAFLSRCA
jgi:hypothetical protein